MSTKHPVSAVALFCEDIREEKGDVDTLIGILPDNVNVSSEIKSGEPGQPILPRVLSKLCIYVKLNFDPSEEFTEGKAQLVLPDGTRKDVGVIRPQTISEAKIKAKENGIPVAGIKLRMVFGGFQVRGSGLMMVEMVLGDRTYLAGAINFKMKEDTKVTPTSSTAH